MSGRNKIVTMLMDRTPKWHHDGYVTPEIQHPIALCLIDKIASTAQRFVDNHRIFRHLDAHRHAEMVETIIENASCHSSPRWNGHLIGIKLEERKNSGYMSPLGSLAQYSDEFVIVMVGNKIHPGFGGLSGGRLLASELLSIVSTVPVLTSSMDIDQGIDGYNHDTHKIKVL